ncbi:hypothetical protein [Rhizobium sp.]|jgi:hypothetical protein|uniref:hypothetical protein n=1 Tax=Rhizobium sp. TaxID=391 RepID=UPI000E908BE4|nr:hypothetical protein [Rhizobium sp.]
MAKKEKLAKAVDVERLRLAFPGVYNDFMAERIPSLRVALEVAGIRSERSRFQKLKNSWKKATLNERSGFFAWLAAQGDLKRSDLTSPKTVICDQESQKLIANGRYLLPQTISRIEAIMTARGMTPLDIMRDMGFEANDRSLLKAMARKAALRLKVVAALEQWLLENENSSIKP